MEPNVFLENFKKQFIDGDKLEIAMKTEFRQIESYDSLTGMTIIVMIKDEYNVDITDNEYKSQKSINDLFNLIQSKLKT